MRAQIQLSFSDWQNLILCTQKSVGKISDGGFQRPVAVSGERWQFWREAATAVGGGGWRRSMVVEIMVNGARWWWWSKEKR